MTNLTFVLDVGQLSAWDRENLALGIMRQGVIKGMTADAEVQGTELTVQLSAPWRGWLVAYEAAVRSWVAQHERGVKHEGDGNRIEGAEGAGD